MTQKHAFQLPARWYDKGRSWADSGLLALKLESLKADIMPGLPMDTGRETTLGGMMGQDETPTPQEATALDMLAAMAAPGAEKTDTPEVFLANLSETLKASAGVDVDLATILADHLLTVTPHANAVANAKSAIVAIASKRVIPAGENANG